MKRLIIVTLSLLSLMLCSTSCFTLMTVATIDKQNVILGNNLGKRNARLQLTTFQKVHNYAALATTGKGDVVCLIADFDRYGYYDGMTISGRFVSQGTISYKTVLGVEKHVLVYVHKRDLKRLESKVEQFLNEQPDVIVENNHYNSI